jgi:GDPmannose 4,6-dehydratase
MMSKRLLITGINGQDGSYLTELCNSIGWQCFGISDPGAPTRQEIATLGTPVYEGSITNSKFLTKTLSEIRPDLVCHLAAASSVANSWAEPVKSLDTNILGTLRLLQALRETSPDSHILLAGSAEMFASEAPLPWNEETLIAPTSPYGIAKASLFMLGQVLRQAGVHVSTAVMFNHESPRRGESFVTRKIAISAAAISMGLQETLTLGNVEVRRDWGFAPEYVVALQKLMDLDTPTDVVLATGTAISVRDFALAALNAASISNPEERITTDPNLIRGVDSLEQRGDASKAKAVLDWRAETAGSEVAIKLTEFEIDRLKKTKK